MTSASLRSDVCVHESARGLLQPWMHERADKAADAEIELEDVHDLLVQEMRLTGTRFADDSNRQMTRLIDELNRIS